MKATIRIDTGTGTLVVECSKYGELTLDARNHPELEDALKRAAEWILHVELAENNSPADRTIVEEPISRPGDKELDLAEVLSEKDTEPNVEIVYVTPEAQKALGWTGTEDTPAKESPSEAERREYDEDARDAARTYREDFLGDHDERDFSGDYDPYAGTGWDGMDPNDY
jgi:hypothetical protein